MTWSRGLMGLFLKNQVDVKGLKHVIVRIILRTRVYFGDGGYLDRALRST